MDCYDRPMADLGPHVAAFVLAGGKSTRMGTDKAFVTLDGRTLLERALDTVRGITPQVQIAGDPAKFESFGPCVKDIFPDCGPLAGIHAALRASRTDLNLVLAVDLPFVTFELLRFLVTRAIDFPAAVVTVPRVDQRLQPLCAVYRASFATTAETALTEGRYKIDALFGEVEMHIVEEDELQSAGFSPNVFRNLNTPEDLAEAQE
jgi:molybdopterin-guanine dinucleotide biosynthesis protein A